MRKRYLAASEFLTSASSFFQNGVAASSDEEDPFQGH